MKRNITRSKVCISGSTIGLTATSMYNRMSVEQCNAMVDIGKDDQVPLFYLQVLAWHVVATPGVGNSCRGVLCQDINAASLIGGRLQSLGSARSLQTY